MFPLLSSYRHLQILQGNSQHLKLTKGVHPINSLMAYQQDEQAENKIPLGQGQMLQYLRTDIPRLRAAANGRTTLPGDIARFLWQTWAAIGGSVRAWFCQHASTGPSDPTLSLQFLLCEISYHLLSPEMLTSLFFNENPAVHSKTFSLHCNCIW